MRVRLLDIDGSLPAQLGMAAAIREGRAQRIDLRDEERALRLWASAKRLRRVMQRLDRSGPPPGHGPTVTFYGSGDYHHLATPLIGAAAESLTVVHFDNHPDWVRFPPTHNCGGWVNRALALANVERIVTLGVCSADLVRPQWQGGNIATLGSGRLELIPGRCRPRACGVRSGTGRGIAAWVTIWSGTASPTKHGPTSSRP